MSFTRTMTSWQRERTVTTWIYYLIVFWNGLEGSCIAISIIFYLRDDLKLQNPKVWAGGVMAVHAFSQAFLGIPISRYVDKNNNPRKVLMAVITLGIVGNLVYTIKSQLFCIIIGRVLCGIMATTNGFISGMVTL